MTARMTDSEFRKQELRSGRARLKGGRGWHRCGDDLFRRNRPLCKNGKHDLGDFGQCNNCDFALQPAEETATGR